MEGRQLLNCHKNFFETPWLDFVYLIFLIVVKLINGPTYVMNKARFITWSHAIIGLVGAFYS